MADPRSPGSSPTDPPPPPDEAGETRPIAADRPAPHGDPLVPGGPTRIAGQPAPGDGGAQGTEPSADRPPGPTDTVSFPPPPPDAAPAVPPPPAGATSPVPPPPHGTAARGTAASEQPRPSRSGLVGLLVAPGVGLLAAAVVLSSIRSRSDGELDWSNYGVGLGATAVLLVLAAVAAIGRFRGRGREDLVAWPGAIGVLGVGMMLGVGLETQDNAEDWLPYLVGGVVVALSVLGYLVIRRGTFVVTAILGLGLLYANGFGDLFTDISDEDDFVVVVAAAIGVFVLGVTLLGWLLPTRALSGVVVGVVGLVGYGALLAWLAVLRLLDSAFGGMPPMVDGGSAPDGEGGFPGSAGDVDGDVWTILVFAGVLTLGWAVAAALQGNPGFTLLAVAMPAVTVPLGSVVLAVEHPTRWAAALAGGGAVLLALAVGLAFLGGRRQERRELAGA